MEVNINRIKSRFGEKFISEWIRYWVKKGKVDRNNINDLYKSLKILEECDFSNLSEELDGN